MTSQRIIMLLGIGIILVAGTIAFTSRTAPAAAYREQSDAYPIQLASIAEGLEHPWGMAFLPDGSMLVTERAGRLRLITDDRLDPQPISGLPPLYADGQGGLLDVLPHPDFADNHLLYLSYSAPGDGGNGTEVMRARLDGHRLNDSEVIFTAQPKVDNGYHFGSRLLWGPDGMLYITLGERNLKDPAQQLSNHHGSIIRLNADGSVPDDNPFVSHDNARPEIVTYGNRNVQGIALQPDSERIWFHEHGPRGGDEVNILTPGANYGWPVITYGIDYDGSIISERTAASGMQPPVIHWTPSIAPSGMAFYTGDAFPAWKGNMFVGALAGRHLRRLTIAGDRVTTQEVLLTDYGQRIRDVENGPDGMLYLLIDDPEGRVLRLEPDDQNRPE